ncbi:MAG: CoA transferase [Dehalococcoidia bacterium]|nr:CoA transferase [Dehalococcoidia bacterium]
MVEGALSDLKVLEYAEHISGPYCTKLMADLGAEVIKIEPPIAGDRARRLGPFPGDIPHPERSGLYLYLNTNKLGITLDPGQATGKDIFKSLLQDADVLVQNYPPKVMADLGLDYESLRKINPRLIMVSIRPMGNAGPYKDYNCYPLNTSAASGSMFLVGRPEREPIMAPEDQTSYQGGINGAAAALVAVWDQRRHGTGQHVDISEAECLGSMLVGRLITSYIFGGSLGERGGHRELSGIYPYMILPCKDGFVSLIALENEQWDRFVEAAGGFEWAKDARFATRFSRAKNADELDALLAPWLMRHTKDEIFELCRARRIPFTPVYNTEELVNSEHLRERDYFQKVDHAEAGQLVYPGAPFKLSETPWNIRRPAPRLGEHNEDIICERLGFAREDLARFRTRGII